MNPVKARLAKLLLVISAFATLGTSLAQTGWTEVFRETFGEGAHPLYLFGGVLQFGPRQDTPFITLSRGGSLEIINETDPNYIRYYFIEPRHVSGWFQAPESLTRVSVKVSGQFGEFPGAGLVYRLDPTNHSFYAFVLTGGNGYGLYVRDNGIYQAVFTDTSNLIAPGSPTTLTIDGSGNDLNLYINGSHVNTVQVSRTTGVGVGIVAAGTGTYYFDDYIIELGGR